jgi:hypothetical protein
MPQQFLTECLVGLFGVAAYNVFFNPTFMAELEAPTQWRHRIRDFLVALISIQFYKLLIR